MSNQQTPIPVWASVACGSVAGSVAEVNKTFQISFLK